MMEQGTVDSAASTTEPTTQLIRAFDAQGSIEGRQMSISAKDVSALRKATGAGMMDCKEALKESGGDFDGALDFLRKKGQKVAAKRCARSS